MYLCLILEDVKDEKSYVNFSVGWFVECAGSG